MRFPARMIVLAALVAAVPTALGAAAGDGLRHPRGYRDLCGACAKGSVPIALRRPLDLPVMHADGACRVSIGRHVAPGIARSVGRGPVYAVVGGGTLVFAYPPAANSIFAGSDWSGNKVLWTIAPRYRGPVLIRGRRLDSDGRLGFSVGGVVAWDELQLPAHGPASRNGYRVWPSQVRVREAGCYGVQVDGIGFSYAIVIRAERALG
jgi:hypothetical protein